ncbi:MAG: hypothetical protein GX535_17040 [Xanthomonadaceae bacterium]|nr:hypothetical protein [Xanthomonadaceae bacterium]
MSVPNSQAVRRDVASNLRAAPAAQRPVARAGTPRIGFAPKDSDGEGSFKINLSDLDIPRPQDQLEVDGLKPTLLSRLLNLFS